MRYRRYQMELALDLADGGMADIDKLDVLSEMFGLQRIWGRLPPSVVENCWENTGLCDAIKSLTDDFHSFDTPHQTAQKPGTNRVVPIDARIERSQVLNEGEKTKLSR